MAGRHKNTFRPLYCCSGLQGSAADLEDVLNTLSYTPPAQMTHRHGLDHLCLFLRDISSSLRVACLKKGSCSLKSDAKTPVRSGVPWKDPSRSFRRCCEQPTKDEESTGCRPQEKMPGKLFLLFGLQLSFAFIHRPRDRCSCCLRLATSAAILAVGTSTLSRLQHPCHRRQHNRSHEVASARCPATSISRMTAKMKHVKG